MTSLEALSHAGARAFPLTVDDYHAMADARILAADDRIELMDGVLVAMEPIGTWHCGLVSQLHALLADAVQGRALVWVQSPLRLDAHSEPQPDLMLLKPRKDFYKTRPVLPADVLLLVEVAESSLRYDRNVKIPRYARQGIPQVWLLDVASRTVTQYSAPRETGYDHIAVNPETLSPEVLPDVTIKTAALWEAGD